MNPVVIRDVILSSVLMVTAAGFYATLYAIGRLFKSRVFVVVSYLFAVLELIGAYGMIRPGYLEMLWVVLIVISSAIYLILPQAMWWAVEAFHIGKDNVGDAEEERVGVARQYQS